MGAEVFAAAAEERAEAEEVTRLEHIGGHVLGLWGQVVGAAPSGLEQVNTIRGALEDGLVSTAVTHLQLSGDLFDLSVPHLLEQVEAAHEAELVGHPDQRTCRWRLCWCHFLAKRPGSWVQRPGCSSREAP